MPAIPAFVRVVNTEVARTYHAEPATTTTAEFAAAAEITFLLLIAGLMCLTLRLAGHGMPWALPAGGLLVALGIALLLTLPVSAGGVMMLSFAAAALAFETLLPGFGVHALAAGVSVLFAGLHLTGAPPAVHPALVAPVAAGVAAGAFIAGRRSWRFRRDRPFDASGGLADRGAVVLGVDGPIAYGVVSGQLWRLQAQQGLLHEGASVRVVEVHDDRLSVRPARYLLTP
jgi:membrane-bound ClpP family serine protease